MFAQSVINKSAHYKNITSVEITPVSDLDISNINTNLTQNIRLAVQSLVSPLT